ncbi:MAG: DNA mismatch repair protein MutS [Methylococcaceae bacterium]|nr:MAG: DNA mismatch repair protein MutS [Methylococcaceae bacterium]
MISDEDSLLFRHSIGAVKRLHHEQAVTSPRRPAPKVTVTRAEIPPPLDFLTDSGELLALGDVLEHRRSGAQQRVMHRLRQGRFAIERDLDLHGATVMEARRLLPGFLARAQSDGVRCVRIIHGKGYRSPEQRPVLKSLLDQWLPQCGEVLAYCSALPKHGGTGAVYVLLRRDPSR